MLQYSNYNLGQAGNLPVETAQTTQQLNDI